MNFATARVAARACRRALFSLKPQKVDLAHHLGAVYQWLCAAQDATLDGGVSGCYNLVRGWAGSYPETTGYIIPTFFHYAVATGTPHARHRAIRMCDWEVRVQLPSGAVRSGMLGTRIGPAVFNTGQVLFGWITGYQATDNQQYADAACRAARWLTGIQDSDGAWRRHLSMLTTSSVQTYNVRTAWGLAVAGVELDERRWIDAALRNCDWALAQQRSNGWFAQNSFSDTEEPLLHTIGYVLEGLLGVGELLHLERFIAAVRSGIEPLIELYSRTGTLRGRYNENWRAAVRWRCITGEAQIAIVLERLSRLTGESRYAEASESLLNGIVRLQDMDPRFPESYGGVAGSHPLWGGYGPFNYLNWAAKFLMDALMIRLLAVDPQFSLRNVTQTISLQAAS